jgi:hypothetical protein
LISVAAIVVAGLLAADRPDTPQSQELFRFDDGDIVEVSETPHFSVHYTRAGRHAVPLADGDSSGVPDHVEELGLIYEDVLDFYANALGYRAPIDDGDGRFDVYLVDFNFSADGAYRAESCDGARCAGFMVQENDFAGYAYPSTSYANRLLASHEFFHAVQAAYDAAQGAVFSEGTAVWASEQFDPSLQDLEGFGSAYLEDTGRPLNAGGSGPVDAFTYGTGIFFEHIAAAHGDDVVRALWEGVDGGDVDWFDILDTTLQNHSGNTAGGFADDFVAFATSHVADATAEPETLPLAKPTLLVFVSSFRNILISPAGRSSVRVALKGDAADLDGIVLAVAADGRTAEVVDGATDVTRTSNGARFVIQVVNTRQDGNGARPRLCVGSVSEVDACLQPTVTPEPESPAAEEPASVDAPSCSNASASSVWVLVAAFVPRQKKAGRWPGFFSKPRKVCN